MRPSEMTPKELLLATVRAYDLPYLEWVRESHPSMEGLLLRNHKVFNPIKSAEQAMWLSLELRMSVRHENGAAIVEVPWADIEPQRVPYGGGAPMLALCLAIVQAAAAVAAKGLSVKNIPA